MRSSCTTIPIELGHWKMWLWSLQYTSIFSTYAAPSPFTEENYYNPLNTLLISSFWRAIFMLFCCLSCDRSFLRPLASLRTDRLFLDTASAAAVESLRWCYSMTVVCKVDRSSWLFLTICMALQSGNHYLVMDRDLTQDKSSRLLIQGLAKYTKNIQGR